MSQKRQLMAQKSYFKRFRLKRVKIAHVILGWKIKSWINFCGTYNVFHYLSSTLLITYILQVSRIALIFFRYMLYYFEFIKSWIYWKVYNGLLHFIDELICFDFVSLRLPERKLIKWVRVLLLFVSFFWTACSFISHFEWIWSYTYRDSYFHATLWLK